MRRRKKKTCNTDVTNNSDLLNGSFKRTTRTKSQLGAFVWPCRSELSLLPSRDTLSFRVVHGALCSHECIYAQVYQLGGGGECRPTDSKHTATLLLSIVWKKKYCDLFYPGCSLLKFAPMSLRFILVLFFLNCRLLSLYSATKFFMS